MTDACLCVCVCVCMCVYVCVCVREREREREKSAHCVHINVGLRKFRLPGGDGGQLRLAGP